MTTTPEEFRESLEKVKDADDPDELDTQLKYALGEAAELSRDLNTTYVRDELVEAIVAPDDEAPYYLNRALDELESVVNADE